MISSPGPVAAASIQVTAPPAEGATFSTAAPAPGAPAGGDDFASAVLGNAWDMADAPDVPRVINIVNAAPGAGGWVGTSSTNDPAILLLDPVAPPRPIDTAKYYQLTFRMYLSRAAAANRGQIIWYPMPDAAVAVGSTPFALTQGWKDYTFDLRTIGATGGSWTGQIRGFRIDPTDEANVEIRLASVRLSGAGGAAATPAAPATGSYTVTWKSTDLPDDTIVDLFCDKDQDDDDTDCEIARDLKAKDEQYVWNPGSLAPGDYYVHARASTDYAALKLGNAWDMEDRSDIKDTRNMRSESIGDDGYEGTTSNTDGQILLNVPSDEPINGDRFKYIRVTLSLEPWQGQQIQVYWTDQNGGQHVHTWAAKGAGEQTYDYVLGERAEWRTKIKELRIDPATTANVEVQLHKVTLTASTSSSTSVYKSYSDGPLRITNTAPAAQPQPPAPSPAPAPSGTTIDITEPYAGMGTVDTLLTIRWKATLTDPAQPGVVSLFYATENTSGNGTKIADVPAQTGQYAWTASAVPMGTYWILAKLTNGTTTAQKYSAVPFQVLHPNSGPGPAAAAPAAGPAATVPTSTVPGAVNIVVEAPTAGQTRPLPLTVSGWAAERNATTGPGVDQIQVYAFSAAGAPPKFLGNAQLGTPRTDLATSVGPHLANAGFTLTTSDLPPGTYQIVVYARSATSGSFSDSKPVSVIIAGGQGAPQPAASPQPASPQPAGTQPQAPAQPGTQAAAGDARVIVDSPKNGESVAQPFPVAGYAYDPTATSGSGVDQVHVYAFPTSGASPYFLGSPEYGTPRPDAAAAVGPAFVNSGFSQSVSGLPAGPYLIVVYAHSSVSGGFSHSQPTPITVR